VGFCFFEGLCAGVEIFLRQGLLSGDRTFKDSSNHAVLMCSGTQFRENCCNLDGTSFLGEHFDYTPVYICMQYPLMNS
jgi:hypothetical protein